MEAPTPYRSEARVPRDVGVGAWVDWALVCAVPLALAGVLSVYLVGRHLADREIVRDGREAAAVVTEREVRSDRRGRPVDFARLAWTVEGRRWRGWFTLRRGIDRTRVLYAPSWPGRAVLAEGGRPRDPSPLGVLIPLLFFGAALWAPVAAVYRRRITKAGLLLREGLATRGVVTAWTLDRVIVRADGRDGAWRIPPVVAAREVSGEVVVLRDATDEGVAAPLEALRPRLSGLRVAVVVAADVVALAAFGWLYLRELIP
jgi:hypothetical protein